MLTPERIYVEEMLDAGAGTDEDVARNLIDLRLINRRLGGVKPVTSELASLIGRAKTNAVSILDVGTGSADIPDAVKRWCFGQGVSCEVTGVDISERNLRITKNVLGTGPNISLVRADARSLPFGPGSFDFVTASLFLHHFLEDDIVRLLSIFASVARRAVVVNDLTRHLVPYYFIKVLGPLFTKSFLTRNDGPISVLRGFTEPELAGLATEAGLSGFHIRRVFPYRLLLVAEIG